MTADVGQTNMIRASIRILSAIAVFIGAAWIYFAPGFEPVLTCIAGVMAFLGSFVSEPRTPETPPVPSSETEENVLSPRAEELLQEIDDSSESSMKGISLMMIDSISGFYVPYVWSNAAHGAITGANIRDIGDVVSAVHELENADFLISNARISKSLSQYRRTGKQS